MNLARLRVERFKEEPFNCNMCGCISHKFGEYDVCSHCEHEYKPGEAGAHDECPECGSGCYEHTCPECGSGTDYLPINTMIGYFNRKEWAKNRAVDRGLIPVLYPCAA